MKLSEPVIDLRWVAQEDANGCGIATLAMIAGKTYGETKVEVDALEASWSESPRDWESSGCTHYTVDRYLAGAGWFVQRRYESWTELPLEPFAAIHYAQVVQPSGNQHFIVVFANGDVLDPLRPGRFRLADWAQVNQLVGLAKP